MINSAATKNRIDIASTATLLFDRFLVFCIVFTMLYALARPVLHYQYIDLACVTDVVIPVVLCIIMVLIYRDDEWYSPQKQIRDWRVLCRFFATVLLFLTWFGVNKYEALTNDSKGGDNGYALSKSAKSVDRIFLLANGQVLPEQTRLGVLTKFTRLHYALRLSPNVSGTTKDGINVTAQLSATFAIPKKELPTEFTSIDSDEHASATAQRIVDCMSNAFKKSIGEYTYNALKIKGIQLNTGNTISNTLPNHFGWYGNHSTLVISDINPEFPNVEE